MILGLAFALCLLSVPLFGGRLAALGQLRIRASWAIVAALVIQTVIISVIPTGLPSAVAASLHIFSYGLALVFVAVNRNVSGMAVLVVGGLLNLAAIGVNGGVMPASPSALEAAGKTSEEGKFINSAVQDDAHLAILGDIFAIPEPVPLANVFSIGDILLVLGGAVVVHRACGSTFRRHRPRALI